MNAWPGSLIDGHPPPWASGWGQDRYGIFASFAIVQDDGGILETRLRWIPPGAFLMGSPDGEPGRYGDEGPQHRVAIGEGFWLAETPCTQALWQAVMGKNPSRFVDPYRPVETVAWDDVQEFIRALNGTVPGLEVGLPSEAQWEFACRAGTDVATWAGPMEIRGECNAPVLDAFAWYGGNSGVEYDLDEGEDSSNWPDKQYSPDKAGTRKVGLKRANPLGLHDMLGNVLEWCADDWHDNYEGAPADGSVWRDAGEVGDRRVRVVRGGSWYDYARDVRSAWRYGSLLGLRRDYLGFRVARVQQGAVPARGGELPPAERRDAPTRPGAAEARWGQARWGTATWGEATPSAGTAPTAVRSGGDEVGD